jgi:hypothetical protein
VAGEPLDAPFRRPVLAWLVGVAACSLALTLAFVIAQPEGEVDSWGADAFSRSALGHKAFVELLHRRRVPVLVSRHSSAERAGRGALLLIAEPRLGPKDAARERQLAAMLGRARTTLLVLPKWWGDADPGRPGWVTAVRPVDEALIQRALAAAAVPATVTHLADPLDRCDGSDAIVAWPHPQLLAPTSDGLRPIVTCRGGVLLGEVVRPGGQRLLVLSDPDVIANHALGSGDHARLALDLLGHARRDGQTVVVDETLHGHERPPVLWRELFAFPLLPAVLQGLLALLAFVCSGLGRFGAPLTAPPALGSGKSLLIDNTAELLRRAGHSAHTLDRYMEAALADVARALHAPAALSGAPLRRWLAGVGRRRGAHIDVDRLEAQVARAQRSPHLSSAAVLAAAQRIHRWKEEMLRGPQDHPGR